MLQTWVTTKTIYREVKLRCQDRKEDRVILKTQLKPGKAEKEWKTNKQLNR